MYMRGLSYHDYLSLQQKSQLQALLTTVFVEKKYTDEKFADLMDKNEKIFSAPYIKKIELTINESQKLLQEFQSTLRYRRGDINDLESSTANALAMGQDPDKVIASLRIAFKELVRSMDKDADRLDQLCRTDSLTSLYNRRAFDEFMIESIDKSAQRALPVSLIFIDIDKFKDFNDSYGHQVGDQALVAVAKIIKHCVNDYKASIPAEIYTARFGGEEFAIIIPGLQEEKTSFLAEIVRKSVEDYNFLIRNEKGDIIQKGIKITISLGIATLQAEQCSSAGAETLLNHADLALYHAKGRGRNAVVRFRDIQS
jgi:diguanylate cyclase (GGDEF)-like protein